jgi:hypothetical protein
MALRICLGVASQGRIGSFLQLSKTYYSNKPVNIESVVRWRHLESPFGPSNTVELVDGEDPVGRMWVQVHEWQVGARMLRAANPCDFLIREDHRRLPAFISLFKSTMNESQQLANLVYHTSNPLTDDLYRKLLKLKPVTELDATFMPVRPFEAAEAAGIIRTGVIGHICDNIFTAIVEFVGRLSGKTKVLLVEPPSILTQECILAEFLAEEKVCATRSQAYREWRYKGSHPIGYKENWITKNGKSIGYIVTSDRDLKGIKACFVIDVIIPGKPSRLTLSLIWFQVLAHAAKREQQAVFFFYNRLNRRLARIASLPMVSIPRRLLPQRVPIFVRTSKNTESTFFDGVNWSSGYFVMSDFDMF